MPSEPSAMLYPRARLDALTDGIYAVAMTLLVLDVRLPEGFEPQNAAQLWQALIDLLPKFYPYVLSFMVLGQRWLASVRVRSSAEQMHGAYVRWWMLNLLLVTCLPFSTVLVGRHASLAPAVWVYAANMGLMGGITWLQMRAMPGVENDHHQRSRQTSSLILVLSALLSIVLSFFMPEHAMWALLVNLAGPVARRWLHLRAAAGSEAS